MSIRVDPRRGLILVWQRALQHWLTRSSVDEVVPNLFLGGSYAAENMTLLSSKNITFVLTIMGQDISAEVLQQYQDRGIEHRFMKKRDEPDENLLEVFGELCTAIEEKLQEGKSVLVHCAMGISRSASVVMAYIMQRWGISRSEAKRLVRAKRNVANPNRGFYQQLKIWDKCHHDIHTVWMIDGVKQFKLEYQQWKKEAEEAEEAEKAGEEQAKGSDGG